MNVPHRRRRIGSTLAVAALLFTVGSCSPLPAETTPRSIDRDKVVDLFPAPTTTTPASIVQGRVCFVPEDEDEETESPDLECEEVDLEAVSPRFLIDALAAGPDDELRERAGLTSFVPPDTRLLGSDPSNDGKTLIVNLSEEITDVSSPNNVRAYQQIVWTLTDRENQLGVDSIGVRVEGEQIKIPTESGSQWTAKRSDFIAKPSTSTTTRSKGR